MGSQGRVHRRGWHRGEIMGYWEKRIMEYIIMGEEAIAVKVQPVPQIQKNKQTNGLGKDSV